jgi:hypothetical protein
MTKAAQHFGKDLSNFMRSPDTALYMETLEHSVKTTVCIAKRGGAPGNGGTWAHPKLAVFFARWLDVRFAVWCDLMVDEILRGRVEVQPVAAPLTPDRTVEDIVKALLPALLPEVRRGVSFIH